ncbi:MAG TPA: hypothetical protein VEK15_29070 [Vicinamibacteria bacterium]|nr:hypothetical protein [Vicinamibacteria bacterium]
MDIVDLVRALTNFDALAARQWVADAGRAGVEWSRVDAPSIEDPREMAIAASVVELLAERAGERAPDWTRIVPPAPQPIFLVRAAASMPRTRRMCEEQGPEPLRRRRIFALPDFLTVA